jgi:sugar lactone lactonase YvrE
MQTLRISVQMQHAKFIAIALFLAAAAHADPVLEVPGYTVELLASGFGAATGMILSPSGELYVTDDAGFRVLRVRDPSSTGIHTPEVVATGVAYPNDLTFAFGGKLLVTSPSSDRSPIVQVLNDGSTQVFASGFSYPVGIATSGPYAYIANGGDGTISRLDRNGVSSTFLSGFGGPHGPFGVSFDAAGNLYFVVHGTGSVYKADRNGATQILGAVSPFGGVFVAATQTGDVFVSDVLQGKVYFFDRTGMHLFASGFAGKGNPPFNGPNDLVLSPSGTLYVADAQHVWRISPVRGSER